ncbi:MAG: histidine--tRNA ligase [Candidatus Colwellbacteria bacterium]|nr:histidine--tRNA ligase [Candidatus Colwellbacteria bacterium]
MNEQNMTNAPKEKEITAKKQPAFQAPKGMRDILPSEAAYWERARETASDIAEAYGFGYVETPVLENTDLFSRGVGGGTDIVEKEMFSLKTKGGDSLSLRPEMTAPVMRSFIENGMSRLPQPVKLWYYGPQFRHENPQSGRFRQFYQTGFEIIGGEQDPVYDAQVIVAAVRFLESMKIKNPIIQINSIGCRSCRTIYRKKLLDFYRKELAAGSKKKGKAICKDCERRMDTNVLRLLDCKEEGCEEIKNRAPSILDSLDSPCRAHFKGVLEFLDEIGLPYSLNPYLVRGLDYYNRTVFEFFTEEENIALGGGGRYDYLADLIGGRPTPAVGVAMGIDRIIGILKSADIVFEPRRKEKIFVVHVGEVAKKKVFALIEELHKANIRVTEALGKDSLQSQMKAADKEGSPIALILGQKEVYEDAAIVRDMKTGAQETVPLNKIVEEIKKRLKS